MLSISLLALTLWGGILVGPFRIAEAELGHHQGCLRAAMASDGHFAIAWVDSLWVDYSPFRELEIFVRFFDRDGNPLSEAYKISKLVDTNWIYPPCIDMDILGNTVLIWGDNLVKSDEDIGYTRFQSFGPDGTPMDSAKTLYEIGLVPHYRVGLSLANNGTFAFAQNAWSGDIWVQRFDLEGVPQDSAFLAHDTGGDFYPMHPQVALSDAGDLVVTWVDFRMSGKTYPRFQVFDAEDEAILPWEPMGHRIDDGEDEQYHGSRPEVYWLDDDRFVVFWGDWSTYRPVGRVFSDRGLTRHPIRGLIWRDSLWPYGGLEGWYSTAVASNDSFAYTHIRTYTDYPDGELRTWEHGGGILGYIQNNEPIRRTNLFEYTPPLGADTVNSFFNNWPHVQTPAVACSDDRIVWVYSRFNPDTIFEAFAMITDWNMGVGVAERPVQTVSPIRLEASLNRLSYDVPDEASLTLYSADGRRILQETIKGKGIWEAPKLPSGVYFARVKDNS
ncbi:MAG: T9SS type A sorting domain-containing protein, partial [candidate division WOR-3 bacterium]|nr:T9SS type A sorting domain-containing protein [candidate division WOR-3 bacterium]